MKVKIVCYESIDRAIADVVIHLTPWQAWRVANELSYELSREEEEALLKAFADLPIREQELRKD